MRLVRPLIVLAAAVLAGSCTAGPVSDPVASGTPVRSQPVYAAVGASETAGVGTHEPLRQAWPRVLWRTALPDAVYYGFGVPGSTTRQALAEQVPEAVAVAPDIATVFLNVNDLIARVPPAVYERALRAVVHALRRGGRTQVLVANVPVLDHLPLYLACRPDPPPGVPPCPDGVSTLPPPDVLDRGVAAYDRAIDRVVAEEGAVLVDLHGLGDVARTHPAYVSDDGFHPSAAGARVVAATFAAALPPGLATGGS